MCECAVKPVAEASTGARLTCLATLNPAAAATSRKAAGERGAAEARGSKNVFKGPKEAATKAKGPKSASETQTEATKKRKKQRPEDAQRKTVDAASVGTARNGVIEFPEEPAKRQKVPAKQQKGQRAKLGSKVHNKSSGSKPSVKIVTKKKR